MNSNQEHYNMSVDVKVSEVYSEQDNYGTVTVEIRLDGKLVALEGGQATAVIEYYYYSDEYRIPVVDATTLANEGEGDKTGEHLIAIGHGICYLRKTYSGVILES